MTVRPAAPLERAGDTATDEEVADLYERFLQAREVARIEEIRTPAKAEGPVDTDEPAADIKAGEAPFDEPDDETAPACVRCSAWIHRDKCPSISLKDMKGAL